MKIYNNKENVFIYFVILFLIVSRNNTEPYSILLSLLPIVGLKTQTPAIRIIFTWKLLCTSPFFFLIYFVLEQLK